MSTSNRRLGTLSFGFVALGAMLLAPLAGCGPNAPQEPTGSSQSAMTVCGGSSSVNGIDISHYDGTIDWQMAAASGIGFAFAKATEGTGFTDPTFATNWTGMQAAGVVRGAYHFFHANVDPTMQAQFVVSVVSGAGPAMANDLPIALDLEVTDGLSGSQVEAAALTFVQAVTAMTGKTAIVYTSPGFFNGLAGGAGFDTFTLWVANWQVSCPDVPPPWTNWVFWQSSATGTVPGVPAAAVDLDTFNGTLAQLQGMMMGGMDSGGPPVDSGSGGTDSGMTTGDSGSPPGRDAGGGGDGGSPPRTDSGALIDSGPHGLGGSDSGSQGNPAAGGGSRSSSGCGCEVGPGAATTTWGSAALLAVMMVAWRVRRREREARA